MVTKSHAGQITTDEFEAMAEQFRAAGLQFELIDGKIVKKMPSKDWHTHIINVIIAYIQMHLVTHDLPGITTSQTTGFRFSEYHCPEPDVAYCSSIDEYTGQHCIDGHWPDLVVEVVSNPQNSEEIQRLDTDRPTWLERGSTVWEVWAQERLVKIYMPGREKPVIEREQLSFENLPGLVIPLSVVFAKLG